MGLGYGDLSRSNPQLVYTSITGFGRQGPWSNLKGYEGIVASVLGLQHSFASAHPGNHPPFVSVPWCSFAASQTALHVLQPSGWPDPIWDACAGQGVKCCALLERGMQVSLASDTHWPRLRRISSECHRLGLTPPLAVQASALDPPLRFTPGTIVLDVPCSGLGVLASRPDIRRHRQAVQLQGLIHLQAAMLEAAYAEVGAGGHIAYITCTQNPAENEDQIRELLVRHPAAKLAQEWNSPSDDRLLEGMYAALLVKTHGASAL
jgi:16S rRNA (cytosine967-C5)-methyltransferase